MRVTECKYRDFKSINSRAYIGKLITTKDCDMSTGYRGSGNPVVEETVEAGTEARFSLRANGSNSESWLEVVVQRPSDKYGRVELRKNITLKMSLEEAAKKLHIDHIK